MRLTRVWIRHSSSRYNADSRSSIWKNDTRYSIESHSKTMAKIEFIAIGHIRMCTSISTYKYRHHIIQHQHLSNSSYIFWQRVYIITPKPYRIRLSQRKCVCVRAANRIKHFFAKFVSYFRIEFDIIDENVRVLYSPRLCILDSVAVAITISHVDGVLVTGPFPPIVSRFWKFSK